METGDFCPTLVCADDDFNTAMQMTKTLIQHAAHVFTLLSPQTADKQGDKKTIFLNALPQQFDRTKYLEIAKQLNIPDSTAAKQITRYCKVGLLERKNHGVYEKIKTS